ncbi:MAG: putative CRISPR-associated protein (Cas_VVA1548) [Methanoregula sp. PtaU1.Bin051]|nr:MAG: putative CRISPR-associated protein (Cas_VVA1548) [Methanoregula sp. PtaU1.Bin051]
MIYIVTRHAGAVAWLRAKGFGGEVVPHLTGDQIRPGNIYIGVLPVPMIKLILDAGSRFYLLMLPEVTPAQRDQEMTPTEMDAAGARLVEVKRIEIAPVDMKE